MLYISICQGSGYHRLSEEKWGSGGDIASTHGTPSLMFFPEGLAGE